MILEIRPGKASVNARFLGFINLDPVYTILTQITEKISLECQPGKGKYLTIIPTHIFLRV